ncbi:phosphotransferase enzyme family-domain-containing protein [Bisporella sp. PMI_857]|nr:phosphotransferase enzyme family-domain-containing protein [Bisporella sp. PMI_857]
MHSYPQRIPKKHQLGTLIGFPDPIWLRELDIDAVHKLAVSCISTDAFKDAEIAPFAYGAFHRLYCISSNLTAAQYLMRVTLPTDPFYKTESEVATMEYVRRHSLMPVPVVIAYSSSASNELGFEWILMEKVDGVPLIDVWDVMSFDSKVNLTVEFAGFMKQLQACRFPMFGNLNFTKVWNQAGYTPILSKHDPVADVINTDIGVDGEFVVGRMPRTRHLSHSTSTDYYSEVDEKLAEDGVEVLNTFSNLEQVIPRIFSSTDVSEDVKVLWHDDLSGMNILVDPVSHKLTGVFDWESVSIVPAWETEGGVPYFLRGIDVLSEPPPSNSLDVNEESLVEIRKDWEKVLLRRKYAEIAGALFDAGSLSDTRVQLKQKFSRQLSTFEDGWKGTRYWLKHQFGNSIIAIRGLSVRTGI